MNFTEIKRRIEDRGITYNDYIGNTIKELAGTRILNLTPEEVKRYNYKTLNLQRSNRISRTYNPGKELNELLREISEPQLWMVITESWCGDSAQSLPYIAAMTLPYQLIDLKILLRDANPDIMDQFLTNGTRSIPIIVAFNAEGEELFRWGPRPQTAVKLIEQWKAEGLQKTEWIEKLHLWYAKDKGTEIEKEFVELLNKVELAH